jgi:ATP-dependent Lhr-like helicase
VGERVFGRRHFIDVVAAFSSPMLLAVRHGRAELGSVHPASLARRDDAPIVILLGGRSWRVVGVDWARRKIDVVPAPDSGKSRWLGSGRPLSASLGRAIERVAAGEEPGCTLSRRASARLEEIRGRLAFVDGSSMPVVRDAAGRTTVSGLVGYRHWVVHGVDQRVRARTRPATVFDFRRSLARVRALDVRRDRAVAAEETMPGR